SEKSLRNQTNHGFLAWAEDPRGRKGALPLERMRKRWRAGHSGLYSFVSGQAKWKSRHTWQRYDRISPPRLLEQDERYERNYAHSGRRYSCFSHKAHVLGSSQGAPADHAAGSLDQK